MRSNQRSAIPKRQWEPRQGPYLLVFFFSGAGALIYEVLWVRLLTLTYGITSYAVGLRRLAS